MQLYIPNLKEIGPVVHEICIPENCPIFFTFFFFAPFYKSNFEPNKNNLLLISFKFGTPIRLFVAYLDLNFGDVKLNLRELWMIIWLKNIQNL